MIVGDLAMAQQNLADELLPIDRKFRRRANVDVREMAPHRRTWEAYGLGANDLFHLEPLSLLHYVDCFQIGPVDNVHLARHQSVHARGGVRDIADCITFKAELQHGAFSIREGLVVGYDSDNALDQETRTRCQNLAFEVIDRSARGLEEYFALDRADQTDARNTEASHDAELLNQMSDQFFFAVGAMEVRKGEEPRALVQIDPESATSQKTKRPFGGLAMSGRPRTVYDMLQLLDFLAPGDPTMVFDLTSHALLQGGKLHGYQYESLGADQFVKMIGRTIADHREIFDDPVRRLALVEVLEVFVEAGWPTAQRLLYRLPEALR